MLNQSNYEYEPKLTGVYIELCDHDRQFEAVSDRALLVNDFDLRNEDEKERLNKLLFTSYEGDTLDTMPSCDCGELKGEYNHGSRCGNCGTNVLPVTEQPLESLLWLKVPEGVHGFISPVVWDILNKAFKYSGVEMIRWFCDRSYTVKNGLDKHDPLFAHIRNNGWKRGINYFIEHFDEIIDFLLNPPNTRIVKPARYRNTILKFINENKQVFFPKYLPIPNRSIFITESTVHCTYVDSVMYSAIDAVRTISSLESGINEPTQAVKENRAIKAVHQLAMYYHDYVKNNLSKKPGMFRRQVYGSRLDHSARCVISSLSEPHEYDELIFPWGMSLMLLKTHLINKLFRRGYNPAQCEEIIELSITRFNPLLYELIRELIDEAPEKGLPVIFQRNPSLVLGSAQLFYVTDVKTDPKINTISISTLALIAPNADFDGDEMNVKLLLDRTEHEAFKRLLPHRGVMDTHTPFTVSGNVALPKPVVATIAEWMHEND